MASQHRRPTDRQVVRGFGAWSFRHAIAVVAVVPALFGQRAWSSPIVVVWVRLGHAALIVEVVGDQPPPADQIRGQSRIDRSNVSPLQS